jgi:hypothetical protein
VQHEYTFVHKIITFSIPLHTSLVPPPSILLG